MLQLLCAQIMGGITIEESIAISRKLEALGFDAIEVSGGIKEAGFATTRGDIPADIINFIPERLQKIAEFREGYFLPQAAAIKNSVSIPVIAVGGLRRREMMEQAILQGQADLIALSRPFIRQPDLVKQMEENPDADPINCINCNKCTFETTVRYKPLRYYCTPNKTA